MIWYWILAISTYAAAALAMIALALALLRRWQPARNFARAGALLAVTVFSIAIVMLGLLLVIPGVGALVFRALVPAGDPVDRARVLAETISETLNASAMSVPTLMLATPIWIIARLKLRKAEVVT